MCVEVELRRNVYSVWTEICNADRDGQSAAAGKLCSCRLRGSQSLENRHGTAKEDSNSSRKEHHASQRQSLRTLKIPNTQSGHHTFLCRIQAGVSETSKEKEREKGQFKKHTKRRAAHHAAPRLRRLSGDNARRVGQLSVDGSRTRDGGSTQQSKGPAVHASFGKPLKLNSSRHFKLCRVLQHCPPVPK